MKTLIELKQAAESKGLRFEVNKWERQTTTKMTINDFLENNRGFLLICQSLYIYLLP